MSEKPRLLCIGNLSVSDKALVESFRTSHDIVEVSSLDAVTETPLGEFDRVLIGPDAADVVAKLNSSQVLLSHRVLEGMPDGVAVLDSEFRIIWANGCLCSWTDKSDVVGSSFYSLFGEPELLGPSFCPFHSALETGKTCTSTLSCGGSRYFRVNAAPLREGSGGTPKNLIVTVRDVTKAVQQEQKMEAIHQAGKALADLRNR